MQPIRTQVVTFLVLAGCAVRGASPSAGAPKNGIGPCARVDVPLLLGRSIVAAIEPGQPDLAASCFRRRASGCRYSFEVENPSDLRASLLSPRFDGALALFGTPLPARVQAVSATELACVDDTPLGDTQHARLDLALEPGSYVLAVAAPESQAGQFELFAELEPLPSLPMVCSAPEPLVEGQTTRGSTRGGASSFAASCGSRGPGPDQLYSFELRRTRRVRLREQSEFDALLSLRSECQLAESEVACSDDSPSGHPVINAELPAGKYYVIVDGQARSEGGDYVLMLETAEPPAVPSDLCAGLPLLATDGTRYELDTFLSPSASAASCGGEGAPEALFRFALGQPGIVTLHASDFEFDPVFSLRRSCQAPESEVLCVPLVRPHGVEADLQERKVLSLSLAAGSYVLSVDGQTPASMGAGTIRLDFEATRAK